MRTIQFLSEKISEGRGDTGWYEIPDHITKVTIRLDRGTFTNPLPFVDRAQKGSPMEWWIAISHDKGKTSQRLSGGNIRGGNWPGKNRKGLEPYTEHNKTLPAGVNRLVRVEYDARAKINKPIGMHFS